MTRRVPAGAAVQRHDLTVVVLSTVIDELAQCGYARLTMEGVARRAGVGKSTLYRRWSSKVAMVTDALAALSTVEPLTSSGDPREDLRLLLRAARDWLVQDNVRAVLPDLIAASQYDEDLARATATHISAPRRAWAESFLDAAPYRDQLSGEQVAMLLDLVVAPVFWRLTHGRQVEDATLDVLVDLLVDPISADTVTVG